jgi:hypothetical protein
MFVIGGAEMQNRVERKGTTKRSIGTNEKANEETVEQGYSRGYFQQNRWWEEDFRGGKWGGGFGDDMQLRSIALNTTGYLRSSSPYHPHGVPIFPSTA